MQAGKLKRKEPNIYHILYTFHILHINDLVDFSEYVNIIKLADLYRWISTPMFHQTSIRFTYKRQDLRDFHKISGISKKNSQLILTTKLTKLLYFFLTFHVIRSIFQEKSVDNFYSISNIK